MRDFEITFILNQIIQTTRMQEGYKEDGGTRGTFECDIERCGTKT